ncbi:hypothetical protein ACRASX_08855 [Flavobacterium sp. TMP13]|uniref:hypothetical protein n=1 Tax=Flavobacterium sp. TMP13 TaxID=3425950 RepID=UPI003D77C265
MNKNVIKQEIINPLMSSVDLFNSDFSVGSLCTLSLHEVGFMINMRDIDCVKRWLTSNNIKIYKRSKFNYVYKIDVECEIDKVRVRDLRVSHPNEWEMRYKIIAKDDAVYEMVVLSLGGEVCIMPSTRVIKKNKRDVELFKKLIS